MPTVAAQVRKDFHWVVFFNETTRDFLAPYIAKWQESVPMLVPIYREGRGKGQSLSALAAPAIIERSEGKKLLLTSRIDNDDGFSPKAFQVLRAYVKGYLRKTQVPKTGIVFDFPVGIKYSTENKNLYLWRRPYSPFMSYLTKFNPEKIKTVHSFASHAKVYESCPVKFITNAPMWLQVIHGNNVSNGIGRKGEQLIGNYDSAKELMKKKWEDKIK